MNEKILEQLQELNLPPNEAKVYLTLLEVGQTSAGTIIKNTALHRSVVYETLDKLIRRKLVFRLTKKNISYYQPTDPNRLLQNIKSQEKIARQLIPNLSSLLNKGLPEITVYEGLESYRRFWIESSLKMPIGSTDYVAGSIGEKWTEILGPVAKQYLSILQKRKICWKMVVFDYDDVEQDFLKKYPNFDWECRLIDRKVTKEGNFNVLANQSVVLHSATEPMIIEVKNASLVKVFKNLFDTLWESGKKIK